MRGDCDRLFLGHPVAGDFDVDGLDVVGRMTRSRGRGAASRAPTNFLESFIPLSTKEESFGSINTILISPNDLDSLRVKQYQDTAQQGERQ